LPSTALRPLSARAPGRGRGRHRAPARTSPATWSGPSAARCSVPRQQWKVHIPAAIGVVLRPRSQGLRRTGESMAQEHAATRVRVSPRAPGAGEFAEGHGPIVAPPPARFILAPQTRPDDPSRPRAAESPPDESDVLYEIAKPPVRAVMSAVWKPTISGAEHIPDQGPVILASNHLAYSDTV